MNTTELTDTAREMQEEARTKAEEWRQSALETARNAGQTADRYVHDNVWTTVMISALAGCTVGWLLGRMRK